MNKSEWLASSDPAAMLAFLTDTTHGPCLLATDRKLRLFACACCRQVWDGAVCERCKGMGYFRSGMATVAGVKMRMGRSQDCSTCHGSGRIGGLTDPRSRRAVEVAERYADGLATWEAMQEHNHGDYVCWEIDSQAAVGAVRDSGVPPAVQASLLRDVWGNPFQYWPWGGKKPMPQWPDDFPWLAWNDGCVRKLAQAIYDERDFGRMPLLADALEEAGCEDAAILGHCRGRQLCGACLGKGTVVVQCDPDQHPWRTDCEMCEACGGKTEPGTGWVDTGPHVRGCWLIDILLGKE